MKSPILWTITAGLALAGASTGISAQEYPTKPVRILSPFAPGGATDTLGRALASPLGRALGQNVIVENRPGASTVIASELVVRLPPDGYNLLINSPSFTVNQFVRKLPYDTAKDFTGITRMVQTALVIAGHPSVPAKSLKELVALARSKPGQLNYATASIAGSQRMTGELFKNVAKVDITHVPFNGGAPATLSTVGGHTTLLVSNVIEVMHNVHTGRLKAFAVSTAKRSEVMPEVPTIAESGYPGFDVGNWFGMIVRTGTPKPIIDKLNAEVNRAMELPEVREPLLKQGLTIATMTPEQFNAFMRQEMERNGKIVKAINLKVD